jgi:hypothetical protein
MENETRFDLNSAVANWRCNLAAHESIGPDEARELESHLHEAIAAWIDKGLTEQEAFEVETRRLGKPAALAREFQAEDPLAPWRNRLYWVALGLITMMLLTQIAKAAIACSSYALAWSWFPEEFKIGGGVEFANERDFEIRHFFEAPAELPLAAALLTPILLYFGSRWRAHSAKNPQSDLYRLTRTRTRTALTFATIATLAQSIEIGADWCGQIFFSLTPSTPISTRDLGLTVGCIWALALLAITTARLRTSSHPTAVTST